MDVGWRGQLSRYFLSEPQTLVSSSCFVIICRCVELLLLFGHSCIGVWSIKVCVRKKKNFSF
jgi:hypothetical protein